MTQENAYFFVVGVGRSGTTLLQSMLNAHPKLAVAPEMHFIITHLLTRPRANRHEAWQRLERDERFERLGLELDQVMRPFDQGDTPFTMGGLFLRLLDGYGQRRGVRIIGEKAPKNVEYLPILHRLAPRGRVIHIIRDPRDVFLSRQKAAWSAGRSKWLQYLAYRAQYRFGRQQGLHLFGDRYIEVFYERLISEPAAELSRLATFLGVEYAPCMADFADSGHQLVAEDEKAWKQNVTGPLLRQNMNKWRTKLGPGPLAQLEAACRPAFDSGDYQSAVPQSLNVRWRLTDVAMGALTWLYLTQTRRVNRRIVAILQSQGFGSNLP